MNLAAAPRSPTSWSGLAIGLLFLGLSTGCATSHYVVNAPLGQIDTATGYRVSTIRPNALNSDSLSIVFSFSGGGTRAAALSYGVMKELSQTQIHWEGSERRLLDEVDTIVAISGGSLTAAYYGLF